jgi:hypothetical protein
LTAAPGPAPAPAAPAGNAVQPLDAALKPREGGAKIRFLD